jgi:hypothetical protein
MADAAAYRGQWVFFLDELERLLVSALGSQSYISLDRDVGRAGRLARGSPALFNGEGSRDCLSVPAKYGPAVAHPHVVFALAHDRAYARAFAAAGAFRSVYIPGALKQLYSEIPWLTDYFLDLGKGQKFYIEMPADLDQFG